MAGCAGASVNDPITSRSFSFVLVLWCPQNVVTCLIENHDLARPMFQILTWLDSNLRAKGVPVGFNLRRSRKIAPGVRVNLSNKGLGLSVGPAHSKLSISPEMKVTGNIGIPGTGVRYTKVIKNGNPRESTRQPTGEIAHEWTLAVSRFNRDPIDLAEWEQTNSDYLREVWFLNLLKTKKKDNSIAPEFPVTSEEVVLHKSFGVLADERELHIQDMGFIYITNKKVVFMGMKTYAEWSFEYMTIFLPFDEEQIMWFQNSDHQDLQGVQIVKEDWMQFQYFIMRAYTLRKSDLNELLTRCTEDARSYSLTQLLRSINHVIESKSR